MIRQIDYFADNESLTRTDFIRRQVIANTKRYTALGGKDELPKDDPGKTDGYFQAAVWRNG
jgi:hypothetical protein